MVTYIELWKAKQTWEGMTKGEREDYMNSLGPAIQNLTEKGVEIVSWGVNDDSTFSRGDYDFFAVWTFPDEGAAKDFEKVVEGTGWYNYFDQVNIMGKTQRAQDVIRHMIEM